MAFFTGSGSRMCRDLGDHKPDKFKPEPVKKFYGFFSPALEIRCARTLVIISPANSRVTIGEKKIFYTLLQVEGVLRFSAVEAAQVGQFCPKCGKLVQLPERLHLYPFYSPNVECFQHQLSLSNQTRAIKKTKSLRL